MSTENELKTPTEWCRLEGVEILDADGWRGPDRRDFDDPITLAEFRARLATCTQRSLWTAAQPVGLEDRYDVQRRDDARGKHSSCRYFVLDPRHDQFARVALWHYAVACEPTQPALARDLMGWLNRVTPMDQDLPTQPAGEHHIGDAPASPISDDMVEQAAKAACEFVYPPKTHRAWIDVDDYEQDSWRATARTLLEAAYPAIRQQVAEEIATKGNEIAEAYQKSAEDRRAIALEYGTKLPKGKQHMHTAIAFKNNAAGAWAVMHAAREIGGAE